jgi:hypothetical protein
MSLIIDVDIKNNTILRPGVLGLCPALGALDERELIVVALVYDNCSPMRRYNLGDRIRRSILQVYENDNNPKLLSALENMEDGHRITRAVYYYKGLQYDRKEAMIEQYKVMIDDVRDQMDVSGGTTKLKKDLESIEMLEKSIKALEAERDDDIVAMGVLKGGADNSLIELWQKNLKNWESIKNKKPVKA